MPDTETMLKRQQVLADFGNLAIRSEDLTEILTEACRLVGRALGTDRAKVLEIIGGGSELFVRAGVGWRSDVVGRLRLPMSEHSSETYSIDAGHPVITQDIAHETRFDVPQFLKEAGIVAFVNVPIFVPGPRAYGILQVDSTVPRRFDDDDIQFLRTYAAILGPVIDRLQLAAERRAVEAQRATEFAAMEVLQRVSAELVGEHEPQVLYQKIVDAAAVLTGSDAASIQMLDPPSGRLKLLAWRGFHPESAKFWEWVKADTGSSCGRALEVGERIVVPDMDRFDGHFEDVEAYRRSRILSVQSTPLRAFNGQVVGMMSTHWYDRRELAPDGYRYFDVLARLSADLIERHQANARMRESEARLAAAFETVPVGVGVIDMSGNAVISNTEYRRFMASGIVPSRDLQGARWRAWDADGEMLKPKDFPTARALRGETIVPGKEMLFTNSEGAAIWATVATVPTRDEQGRVTGAVTAISDINAAKRAAEALRASEERLRQFGEASLDVLWIRDAEKLQWQYLTPAFEAIYGLSREEALGGNNFRNWLDLIIPEDRERAVEAIGRVRKGERVTFDYRIRRPADGAIRWLRNTDFPIIDAAGRVTLIGGVGHDLTELRETQNRLQVLMEGIPQLVWRADDAGDWTWSSPQWSDYTGLSQAESAGLGWLNAFHPDDRGAARLAWRDAPRTGELALEARINHAATREYRWFKTRAVSVRNEAGTINEWLGTSTDVHDIRDLQDRQLVLVRELQHRTRNLIGVIRSLSEKTARASGDLPEFRERFGDRLEALSRVQGLLSRLTEHDRVTFDELIESELAAMNGVAEGVSLAGPRGIRLRSSTVQTLAMAFHELATNAVKYGALGQPQGKLTVTWSIEPPGEGGRPWLRIDWIESGVSMPPPGARPNGGGQGRELIERALPYQLGARTDYRLGADGVHCTITIPVSATASQEEADV